MGSSLPVKKDWYYNEGKLFSDYYSINDYGYWEHNNYVLIRKESEETIIKKHNINSDVLRRRLQLPVRKLRQFGNRILAIYPELPLISFFYFRRKVEHVIIENGFADGTKTSGT